MPGRKRITLTVINQISPVFLYVMLRRLGILAAWAAGRELEVLGTSTRVLDLSRVFF